MVVVASTPGTGTGGDPTHSIVYGEIWSSVFRLVIPTDGIAIASSGVVLSKQSVKIVGADKFLTVHQDPVVAGALYLATSRKIWYRDANSAMSVVAGGLSGQCKDGVGEAASFAGVRGLLSTRNGKTLYATDDISGRVRQISFETAGSKVGTVITIAGDGEGANRNGIGRKASLCDPREMLWISDEEQTEMFVSCAYQINRLNLKTSNQPTHTPILTNRSCRFCVLTHSCVVWCCALRC